MLSRCGLAAFRDPDVDAELSDPENDTEVAIASSGFDGICTVP